MKKTLIIIAIIVVVVVLLLAFYKLVPFYTSLIGTGAFIAGAVLGWYLKGWSDSHIVKD